MKPMIPETAGSLLEAQGVSATPQAAEAAASFAALVLGSSANAFAQIPFEAEPANYIATLDRNAL